MWMPTFDASGMPSFVNPMQMVTMAWNQGEQGEDDPVVKKLPVGEKSADRDVRRLGSFFSIDQSTMERLDELLERRKDSRERDLAKLYEVLETARNPSRLLMAKLEEMEDGQFVANFKRDEHIDRLCEQYELNDAARCRLVELRVRRKGQEDHARLEEHLQLCSDPSFTTVSLVKKVTQGRLSDIPDLSQAKILAERLDQVATRKLRDVVEKRAISNDLDAVLTQIKEVLEVAFNPSMSFMKVVDTYLQGGLLEANTIEVIRLESKQQIRAMERQKKAAKKLEKKEKKQKKAKKSSSSSDSSESSDSSSSGKKKKKSKKVKKKGKTKKGKSKKDKKVK